MISKYRRITLLHLLIVAFLVVVAACGTDEKNVPSTPTKPLEATGVEAVKSSTATPTSVVTVVSPISPLTTPDSPLPTVVPDIPVVLPMPSEGKAVIAGELYSFVFDTIIPGTAFYLTPAVGENKDLPPEVYYGAQPDKGDIRGTSDENGRFVLKDVQPGSYFLMVWVPYGWVIAVDGELSQVPRLFVLEAGQRLNFDRLYFDWPNG